MPCTRSAIVRQAGGAVVHRVHARDVGEQHLRGADVAGGLLPTDVLLARLQREPQRGTAFAVDRHTHQTTGHAAPELVARGEVAGVRAAVAHRHTEALRGTDDHIRTPLPRRGDQHQGEEIGGHRDERALRVEMLDQRSVIVHHAVRPGVLQQHAEHAFHRQFGRVVETGHVGDHDIDAHRFGARAHHFDGLRVTRRCRPRRWSRPWG